MRTAITFRNLKCVTHSLGIAAAFSLLPVKAQAPGDIRVALVIGNAAYAGNAALANPVNDARAMSDTLRGLGFTVVELRDSSKAQMTDAIAKVQSSLKGQQGVGMLYYAGHGMQLDWRNYMVPVDAKLQTSSDIPAQTVDIEQVIAAFKTAGNRMNILVLDACRDNPFAQNGSRPSAKGLAPLDAPPGTFLAYATAPGNVAEDGDTQGPNGTSGNGLYTQYLLQELKKPIAKIEDVFKRVRLNVRQKSQGRQIPWESTSLEDDFFFNDGRVVTAAVATGPALDKAFAIEKADWDKIKSSASADDFYAFLKTYPTGLISQQAVAALERLDKAKITAQADKNGMVQTAEPKFRLGDTYEFVTKDGYSGKEMRRGKTVVTRIADGVVEINNGKILRTIDGGVIKNQDVASFDPPRLDQPGGDFVVGMKWTGRTIKTSLSGKSWAEDDTVKIVALEDVTVPAGTFKAYKFEMDSALDNGKRVKLTYWVQPGWGQFIRMQREIRSRTGPTEVEITEMVSRQRGAS
jgi:hypothetical protein